MYKELVIAAMNAEEISMNLQRQVARRGGLENLTEDAAKQVCTVCRIRPESTESPEEAAYQEYRQNRDSLRFWKKLRADLGEAKNFGEMCGYDASGDKAAFDRYTSEITRLDERQKEIYDAALKGAKKNGRQL